VSWSKYSRRIYFISIYIPDINKPKEKREIFFEELQDTVDKVSNNENIFILDDFNLRIRNTPISSITQQFSEDTINDNDNMLIAFCPQNELRINNTF